MLLLGIGLVAVSPLLGAFALGDEQLLLVDISLSTMLACGMFLGAFTAASSLGDQDNGTAGEIRGNRTRLDDGTVVLDSDLDAGHPSSNHPLPSRR